MLGEKALELVRETSRSQDMLGPYNEDKVRSVLEEIRILFEANQEEMKKELPAKAAMMLRHAGLERNKRCLLAYLNHRSEKIREMRWQFGAILPLDVKANLCEAEQTFFAQYNRNLADYMRSVGSDCESGGGVDLMTDQTAPKSLYVEVRCVQDYGQLEMEDGSIILLKKNTQHFLPRSQCEQLIRQGVLEHVVS